MCVRVRVCECAYVSARVCVCVCARARASAVSFVFIYVACYLLAIVTGSKLLNLPSLPLFSRSACICVCVCVCARACVREDACMQEHARIVCFYTPCMLLVTDRNQIKAKRSRAMHPFCYPSGIA